MYDTMLFVLALVLVVLAFSTAMFAMLFFMSMQFLVGFAMVCMTGLLLFTADCLTRGLKF